MTPHVMTDLLYGRNPVLEALRAKRRTIRRLLLATGVQETGAVESMVNLARAAQIPITTIDRRELEKRVQHGNHQGVVLETGGYPYADLDDTLRLAGERQEPPFLLLLDHVQDPQNVGTLLRTADVVGVHGVILPGHRAAHITPAVVSASSGATEHLLIVEGVNLAQTIRQLQKEGVWVVGVEDDERADHYDRVDLAVPLALVVGAEGPGLARLTRERCDRLIRLPMRGHLASLNVAVAGSIVLYHAWRCRETTG